MVTMDRMPQIQSTNEHLHLKEHEDNAHIRNILTFSIDFY